MEIDQLYQLFLSSSGITTDTRKIKKNMIFFALKGDKFNGNEYAMEALEKGASYAVIDEIKDKKSDRFIFVENTLQTLQNLANHYRNQLDIPVIAITGTNGKTTTKELIGEVLKSHYKTYYTQGNFNNHIGVPLTLLAIPSDCEVAVVEMGANHIGEIDALCKIANPTHGLITNIGKAHLEGFGSLEGVKQTKSELYRFLNQKKGFVFINLDELYLAELAQDCKYKIAYKEDTSFEHPYIYQVEYLNEGNYVKAAFANRRQNRIEVKTNMIGRYNFNNIMSAIAVGKYFKVPSVKIKEVLEDYVPQNNRSQIVKDETNTYILDAYNANPSSMNAALDNFKEMEHPNKIVILGDMLELGDDAEAEHQNILNKAIKGSYDKVITVGENFQNTQGDHITFKTVDALKDWFDKQLFKETHFLLKGSRGIKLEQLLRKTP